jgi:hypothetical protein
MGAETRLESFTSGTTTGTFTGSHAVNYVVLCGVSGTATIPLRCSENGVLLTGSISP